MDFGTPESLSYSQRNRCAACLKVTFSRSIYNDITVSPEIE
ncbi:hypothetical protein HMPREF1548_00838 [Clostridium sp. KLE 1755]|nr:hypothetical protein HMPREF1548_00838 [Clostridium sp. KLE 1755]